MIRILFFGSIASKAGQREMLLPAESCSTLADVVKLAGCDTFKPLLVAVNQQQEHDLSTLVHDGDEVAMMPPFSGG